jgi:hypothetical protein
LFLNLKYTYHEYDLKKRLHRNKWTMFSIIHTKEDMKIFIDGAIHFSFHENFTDSESTDLIPFYSVKCINLPSESIIQLDEKGRIIRILDRFLRIYFLSHFPLK